MRRIFTIFQLLYASIGIFIAQQQQNITLPTMSQSNKKRLIYLPQLTHSESSPSLQLSLHKNHYQSSRRSDHLIPLQDIIDVVPIEKILRAKRELFDQSMRQSVYKLNTTLSWAKQAKNKAQDLEKKQTKINSKKNANLKIVIERQKIKISNQNNAKDLTYTNKIKDDGFVPQNNLFLTREQSLLCYDGTFSLYRQGCSLIFSQNNLYLYGGNSHKAHNITPIIHAYNPKARKWSKKDSEKGLIPFVASSYHSLELYRNYMIIIGGIMMDTTRNQRYYNFQVNLYDTLSQKWSKLHWNQCLRSHASTLYGNMLMVYGGINEKEQFLNKIYFITLNPNCIEQSTIMQFTTEKNCKSGIAFHKMVNTYQLQPSIKQKVQFQGVISYGGKYSDDSICSEASIFRLKCRNSKEGSKYILSENEKESGWEIMSLKGKKPQGRYEHTMNIMNKKGICLIVGGINDRKQILRDVWIMDLCSASWLKAEFEGVNTILQQGIAGHCSAIDNNTIYIFGNVGRGSKATAKFFTIDFAVSKSKAQKQTPSKDQLINKQNKMAKIREYFLQNPFQA